MQGVHNNVFMKSILSDDIIPATLQIYWVVHNRGVVVFLKLVGLNYNRSLYYQKNDGPTKAFNYKNLKIWWGPGPPDPFGDAIPA